MDGIEQVVLEQQRRGWSVTLHLDTGCVRRYRYASEAQARFFAAVFALGPRVLPPARRAASPRRRRTGAQPAAALP